MTAYAYAHHSANHNPADPPSAPVWVETKAADLDPLQPSGPLRETELGGLAAREVIEPDVFRHFFGAGQR